MPQLKRSEKELKDRKLLEAIAGSSVFFDLSPDEQAQVAGISRSSWYRRLSNPGLFSIDEFRRMAKRYRWDDSVILQIVR